VPVPQGKDMELPREAGRILDSIVYLPFYPELPMKEIERMGELLISLI